jgi:tetratricopeptide (TPR) repeat protein
VTFGSLLQDRRRTLDGRIVETLERLYPDRLAEHIEQLAHHAFRGEFWDRAVTYLRQAGAKAFARSANREAVAYFEQAVTALTHLPETPETLEQGVDVRLALRNSFWPLGRYETALGHLRDAESLATELGDQRRLGWIGAYLSEHTRQMGHAADAPRFAERALAIGEGLADLPLRVAASYYLGTAYFVAGDYRRTDEFFARIIQLLEGDRVRERCGLAGYPAVMSRVFWTFALAERGDFDEGRLQAEEAVRLAEALDHPYSLVAALRALSRVHGARGDFDHAIRLAERSLALSRDRHLLQLSPEAADQLGHVYALSGRVAESLPLLQEALTGMEAMAAVQWRSPLLVHLGEAYLLAHRPADALAMAARSLALAREHGHRGSEAWALRLLGEIASPPEHLDVATAEAHYSAALALASELGMRPLAAHCHLGLGELYRLAGKRQESRERLAAATTMYREMEMGFWLEQAEPSA